MVKTYLRLFAQAPKRQTATLFMCLLFAGLTDGVGLLLIIPMLGLLNEKETTNPIAAKIVEGFEFAGLPLTLPTVLALFVFLVVLRSLIQLAQERSNASVQNYIVDELRVRCFTALLNAEWRWLVTTRRSDHANLLLGDVNRIGLGLHYGLALISTMTVIGAYVLVAFLLSPQMASLALVSGGLAFALLMGHHRQALTLGVDQTRANRALQNNVQESLSGIKLAKILGNERRFLSLFNQTLTDFREQQLLFIHNTGVSKAFFQMVGAILLAAYLYLGIVFWQVPTAEILTLILIFSRLVPMLMAAQHQLHHCLHSLSAVEEAENLLGDCEVNSEQSLAIIGAPMEQKVTKEVRVSQVSVSYADREKPALSNVSMIFPARTTTAIMGPSGSGKSTLADILMGLLSPDSGSIFVDGQLIEGNTRLQWRNAVAYVPQDSFLFHDTIRGNLLWGNLAASEDDLHTALKKAAAEFVFGLPLGLDTLVGDGGDRLSGGERQRIALARALLKQPALLILDEATSSLDLANEARIRNAIEDLHGDLTVVIIGHRLPTLEHADQVIFLEDGLIRASGSWKDVRTTMNELKWDLSRPSTENTHAR